MNKEIFISLIRQPELLDTAQVIDLEKIIQQYPYFQSARALHLKGIFVQNSFQYNNKLKETAAFTADRAILFDFITSQNFKKVSFTKTSNIEDHETNFEIINSSESIHSEDVATQDNLILAQKTEDKIIQDFDENSNSLIEKLEIGKPLNFDINEKHSFEEWLKLTKLKPIHRTENQQNVVGILSSEIEINTDSSEFDSKSNTGISQKIAIIDKFIEANPKITPKKEDVSVVNISLKNQDSSMLMTETLAKIYLEQKKYQRAIQAYEILILKYPEKSYFFADRIEDIKKLQQNNS